MDDIKTRTAEIQVTARAPTTAASNMRESGVPE
jgi:hypothetical protein